MLFPLKKDDYRVETSVASGPLRPFAIVYSTFCPSRIESGPPLMFDMWTKTSFPPASGVMNPKPFCLLKNLTVPLLLLDTLFSVFFI